MTSTDSGNADQTSIRSQAQAGTSEVSDALEQAKVRLAEEEHAAASVLDAASSRTRHRLKTAALAIGTALVLAAAVFFLWIFPNMDLEPEDPACGTWTFANVLMKKGAAPVPTGQYCETFILHKSHVAELNFSTLEKGDLSGAFSWTCTSTPEKGVRVYEVTRQSGDDAVTATLTWYKDGPNHEEYIIMDLNTGEPMDFGYVRAE